MYFRTYQLCVSEKRNPSVLSIEYTCILQKDDIVPSSTSLDDGNASFDLSSPMRYNSDKVFLHSPRPVVSMTIFFSLL